MLEFKNVSICKGLHHIVKNINFTAKQGEITVLLGENGSGKTTLIRAINSLEKYTGDILLGGEDLSLLSARQHGKMVSLLPQVLPQTSMKVYDLLALGRNPYLATCGQIGAVDREAINRAARITETENLLERKADTLSGGERQRVFIAMTLCQETPFLVWDEPTTYMDVSTVRAFEQLCFALRQEGRGLLVVLHDISMAVRLADHIGVLSKGHISFEGSKEEFVEQRIAEKLYGVRRRQDGEDLFYI